MDVSKRNSSLDITRIVALFSVISMHFFLYTGFYSEPMLGKRMLVLTVIRTAFNVCVPLFIVLSGYLLNKKVLSGRYYLGIVRIIGIYILASAACMIYKSVIHGAKYTFKSFLFGILDFSGANYSWYIEMYIGLFLLIPFLNLIYNGLDSRRSKTVLLATLVALTILPSVVNIHNFEVTGWFKTPYLSISYQPLIPDWWVGIYPITYYFLGAYLKEYPVKMKKMSGTLLFGLSVLVFGLFNYYRSWGGFYSWGAYQDWFGLPTFIQTFLLFVLLSSRDTSMFPMWSKKLLAGVSELCLGAYLVSYIFDDYFYAALNLKVNTAERIWYFVPMVLAVAAASFILSWLMNLICDISAKSAKMIASAVRKNKVKRRNNDGRV